MFLTSHALCCSLAEHNLNAPKQSTADAVPLSCPHFPALFPLLPFLAQVETVSNVMVAEWAAMLSLVLPLLRDIALLLGPQPAIIFKACSAPGQGCMNSVHAALRYYLLLGLFDATIMGASCFFSLFFFFNCAVILLNKKKSQ